MDKNSKLPEPLMTTEQLAAYLGVSVRTVHDWRIRGVDMPPAYRVGRHLRFRPDEVESWVGQRRAA